LRVAAVQYAGFPLTEFALGTYPSPASVREHLEKMGFQAGVSSGRRTGYALRKAETELFRTDRGARFWNPKKYLYIIITKKIYIIQIKL
jgi:hypothetical protein